MKKILTLGLLIASTQLFAAPVNNEKVKAHEQALDKMVAVVNDDVITTSELTHALANAKVQLMQERSVIPSDAVLKKQVLDQLINKKVQLQMAKAAGIQVTEDDLNKAINRIAKQNNITVKEMYEHINHDGMTTSEYRNEMRDQFTLQKLQQQEVASHITITQQEISNFMRSHTWQANRAMEYHLQDILIPVSDTPSPEELAQAKTRADEVLAKLKMGDSFEQLAQSDSSGKQALQGGDLGWRKIPEIPTAFSEKVTHMKANEMTGPIQTPNGYHIIRLLDVRSGEGHQPKPDRKTIENLLLQQKFEEAVQNWVSKLRSQAFIITNPI